MIELKNTLTHDRATLTYDGTLAFPHGPDNFLAQAGRASKTDKLKLFEELAKAQFQHFRLIYQDPELTIAIVDHVRTLPLFYRLNATGLEILTNVTTIQGKVINSESFLLSGFTQGNKTLCDETWQIPAGCGIVKDNRSTLPPEAFSYYRFQPRKKDNNNILDTSILETNYIESIERALPDKSRPIALPLSAGYDSRLIAHYLHQLGYKDVHTFSFGVSGNRESEVSRSVAENLGFRWTFVNYDSALWKRYYHSEIRNAYFASAGNLSSLPLMLDWLAIGELSSGEHIPRDSILVPGHTGDFLTGNHIPTDLFHKSRVSGRQLVNALIRKHYSLWQQKYDHSLEEIKEKVYGAFSDVRLAPETMLNSELATALFERYDWQERQAKFICNASRAYEFWGYDWAFPLWDRQLCDYWGGVDRSLRYRRKGYIEFSLETQKCGMPSIDFPTPNTPKARIEDTLGRFGVYSQYRKAVGITKNHQKQKNHPLGWYSLIEPARLDKDWSHHQSINSFFAEDYISSITKT